MIVGDRNTRDRIVVELRVRVDRIAAASEKIAFDDDVGDRAKLVVDHDSAGSAVRIDDRVLPDDRVRDAAIDLDTIVMWRPAGIEIVNKIVFDQIVPAGQDDAVFDVRDVVALERTLSHDSLVAIAIGTSTLAVDRAIPDDNSCPMRIDLDNGPSASRDAGHLDGHVIGVDDDAALNVQS